MLMRRAGLWMTAVVAGLLTESTTARGQGTRLLTWRGEVDREARITVRGARATVELDGREKSASHLRLDHTLPGRAGEVSAALRRGRGRVEIVQQPTAANRYTAIVRVSDPRGGADRYVVELVWRRAAAQPRAVQPRAPFPRTPNSGIMGTSPAPSTVRAPRATPAVLHWVGDVDGEVQVRWRGRSAAYRNVRGVPARNVGASVSDGGLPHADVSLVVHKTVGRGEVLVIQQPSRSNDYTAIIRVSDPRGGIGHYDFDVTW